MYSIIYSFVAARASILWYTEAADGIASSITHTFTRVWLAVDSPLSVLKAETFRCLEESSNLDEFLRANTGGCSPLMFPTLLGLRLAEDFELGTRYSVVRTVCLSVGMCARISQKHISELCLLLLCRVPVPMARFFLWQRFDTLFLHFCGWRHIIMQWVL